MHEILSRLRPHAMPESSILDALIAVSVVKIVPPL
jgi:hypothetical protein